MATQPANDDQGSLAILRVQGATDGNIRLASVKQGGRLRNMLQFIDRTFLAGALGVSFDGSRDLWKSFGWDKELNLNQIMDMYLRGGIAKRIVDAKAEATWGRPPRIYLPGQDQWVKDVRKLIWDIDLWHFLKRADILAGLGRFSLLVIGTNRGSLANPLPKGGAGSLKITFLQPYSELQAKVKEWDNDPTSPRFGLPLMYTVMNINSIRQLNQVTNPAIDLDVRPKGTSFDVHWSRAIHICKNGLTNDVYGTPDFAPVWNYLSDLMKVTGSSSESYWRNAYPGLHMDVDKEMDLDEEDEANLTAEMDDFQHEMRRFLRTRGVKVTPIDTKPADPRGAYNVLVDLISGTTGIPRRILLGSEAGQLASTQDKANWAERIEEYREIYAEPRVIWPFIQWLVTNNVVPLPAEADLSDAICLWPDAYRMSPLERGQTAAQTARSLANIAKGIAPIEMEPGIDPTSPTPDTTDPVTGVVTKGSPGDPGKPPVLGPPLITRDEARRIIGLSTDQQMLTEFPDDIA